MALEIKGMKRVFKMKKNSQEIVLDDPNVNMSPAEVMDFYSMNYPELTTATTSGASCIHPYATRTAFMHQCRKDRRRR